MTAGLESLLEIIRKDADEDDQVDMWCFPENNDWSAPNWEDAQVSRQWGMQCEEADWGGMDM